ncbi:acyl-protein thioesterase 2-like [Gigantopelta aegis]|uniref:acyl-protein thioesterase 2-like n=1 Tax=Gigantopelta aegis TaxID=1735272 RepID=UPI001B88C241|nr:acyl-protein thioesterase 2-like [Gigantopelta aegis]
MASGSGGLTSTLFQRTCILFLHGLGDTGHGWSQLIGNIRPSHAKVICPTAFDIYNLAREGKQDEEGIKNATKNANRILLGGFSQGGSLAIISALTYPHQLAGLLCLSCWVPVHEKTMKVKLIKLFHILMDK